MAKNPLLYRLTAVTAIAVVAGAALAGCSSSSSGSNSSGTSTSGGNTSSSGGSSASIVLGSPGVPPVISGLLPYIADKQGFYKKYGVNVTIKSFDTGTDATRAAATGQIDAAMLFVTHSIDEAVLMGDRVVILRGRPSTIFDIVDVGIPGPRTRAVVDSDRFRSARDYVWRAVMEDELAGLAKPAAS